MKKSILIVGITLSILATACVDRKTNSDGEIRLKEQAASVENEAIQSSPSASESAENQAAIVGAKKVINEYFTSLERGNYNAAYEAMSQSSDRGTSSEFAEKHASVETASLSFGQDPEVISGPEGIDIKMPLRYTIKTKDGNEETYNGSILVVKGNTEDSDYKIQGMNMTREDS